SGSGPTPPPGGGSPDGTLEPSETVQPSALDGEEREVGEPQKDTSVAPYRPRYAIAPTKTSGRRQRVSKRTASPENGGVNECASEPTVTVPVPATAPLFGLNHS